MLPRPTGLPRVAYVGRGVREASSHAKSANAPPERVVNFRNMQRRRNGPFRTDIRVASSENTRRSQPSLREHLFQASHEVNELARGADPARAFHEAHTKLQERMAEWHVLAGRIRAQDPSSEHIQPQHAAAAWNQVILLAVRAGMPSAAWRTYAEMKRAGVRPTARTYAGYFTALSAMVRTRKVNLAESRTWLEHLPKLYAGLEQVHTEAASSASTTDDGLYGQAPASATGGRLSQHPAVQASKARVLWELRKDPQAIVAAYTAYISLLCAIGRPAEALAVWDAVCPDPYPGRRPAAQGKRLPRTLFATAPSYTAVLRAVAMSNMPTKAKQAAIRALWTRWQYDLLSTTRTHTKHAPVLLDSVAVKTLVWTLGMGHASDAPSLVNALLGTYVGVVFRHTPGAIRYSVPSTWKPIPFATPALLVDTLAFYDQHQMYGHVLDCFEHARKTVGAGSVDPTRLPEAVAYAEKARRIC